MRGGVTAMAREGEADPDTDAVTNMAAGDARAFRDLMDRHLPGVLSIAGRMLGSPAEAEDVAQDVFLRAWRSAAKWRGKADGGTAEYRTWLYRVAANASTDRLRKRRPVGLDDIAEPADPAPGAEQVLNDASVARSVRTAIQTLPDRQRAALILSHYQGLGNPEIGAILEISVEAVESLLSRARRALRERLKDEMSHLLDRS